MGMPSFAHGADLVVGFGLVDFFVYDIAKVLLGKLLDGEEKYLLTPSCKVEMC